MRYLVHVQPAEGGGLVASKQRAWALSLDTHHSQPATALHVVALYEVPQVGGGGGGGGGAVPAINPAAKPPA